MASLPWFGMMTPRANQKVETHPYFYSIDGVNPWKAKPNSHDGRRKDRTLLEHDSALNKILHFLNLPSDFPFAEIRGEVYTNASCVRHWTVEVSWAFVRTLSLYTPMPPKNALILGTDRLLWRSR